MRWATILKEKIKDELMHNCNRLKTKRKRVKASCVAGDRNFGQLHTRRVPHLDYLRHADRKTPNM